jgi:DNA repair exonuclease SbcCD ATPase subunit
MKLLLKNFKCWKSKEIDLPDYKNILIDGSSGIGKSSILDAIQFVLYGEGTSLIRFGETKMKVEMSFQGLTIERSKGPNSLIVDGKFKDREAQLKIDEIFGTKENFTIAGYIEQKSRNNFVIKTPLKRLEFLENFAFNEIDNISDVKKNIKLEKKELEKQLVHLQGQEKVFKSRLEEYSDLTIVKPDDNYLIQQEKYKHRLETIIKNIIIYSERNDKSTKNSILLNELNEKINVVSLTDLTTDQSKIMKCIKKKELELGKCKYNYETMELKNKKSREVLNELTILNDKLKILNFNNKDYELIKQKLSSFEYNSLENKRELLESKIYSDEQIKQLECDVLQMKIKNGTTTNCPYCSKKVVMTKDQLILPFTETLVVKHDDLDVKQMEKLIHDNTLNQQELDCIKEQLSVMEKGIRCRLSFNELLKMSKQMDNDKLKYEKLTNRLKNISTIPIDVVDVSLILKEIETLKEYIRKLEKKLEKVNFKITERESDLLKIKWLESEISPIHCLEEQLKEKKDIEKRIQCNDIMLENIKRSIQQQNVQEQYNVVKRELNSVLKRITSTSQLYEKIIKAQVMTIDNIIYTITNYTNELLDYFFQDDPLQVVITTISKTNKPLIEMHVIYKGIKMDIKSLSGGQYDRLVLAMSIGINKMFKIPIIMLDEIISSLDVETCLQVMYGIKKLYPNHMVINVAHQVVVGNFDYTVSL